MTLKTHNWIELDPAALRQNFATFCQLLGRERVAPVLKANAYGHGLKEIYEILAPEPPAWLGVNYTAEGALLRQWGFKGRVLVLGPAFEDDLVAAHQYQLELVLGQFALLRQWLASPQRPKIHIKIDTGMARQGFRSEEVAEVAELLLHHRQEVLGLLTHFANVEDVSETTYATSQLQRLGQAKAIFAQAGFQLLCHAASSASSLLLEESRLDLCRVGIALYGLWPSRLTRLSYLSLHSELAPLRPVLSWKSRVSSLRSLKGGEFVGYGCTFRAAHPMRLAVVAVGYYEGYPRLAGSQAGSYVLIRGQRCPLVGRVCMNMLMVDVSGIADLELGEVVTLIGRDGEEKVSAEDLAEWAHTINYEVVTRLCESTPRLVRAESPLE